MYLMIGGTIIFVMSLEWIGHRLHSTTTTPWVAVDLVQLGHAAFSVLVTTAIYFPLSAFSYIIFSLGITKFMYPEITYTMWMAYIQAAEELNLDKHEEAAFGGKTKQNPIYQHSGISLWNIALQNVATDGEEERVPGENTGLVRGGIRCARPVRARHQSWFFSDGQQQKESQTAVRGCSAWQENHGAD